jgi:hypothetical protein
VIFLTFLAVVGGLLGLLFASQATIGVAFLAFSILPAVFARIAQANAHHAAVMKQLRHDEHTTLRNVWSGYPVALGITWTLKKRNHISQCVLFSHEFGWELRLHVGALFRTQVCRSTEEILKTQESWKAAMMEKGWQEDPDQSRTPSVKVAHGSAASRPRHPLSTISSALGSIAVRSPCAQMWPLQFHASTSLNSPDEYHSACSLK